jgi:hypothetical protein
VSDCGGGGAELTRGPDSREALRRMFDSLEKFEKSGQAVLVAGVELAAVVEDSKALWEMDAAAAARPAAGARTWLAFNRDAALCVLLQDLAL